MTLLDVGNAAIESVARISGGRFGWCATTKMRWRRFCIFCEGIGISMINQIDVNVLRKYGEFCNRYAASTAQNYISSVNSVMKIINKNFQSVSPREIIGRSRISVRKKPVLFCYDDIQLSIDELKNNERIELAAVVFLAANFGLRRRECSLIDISVAIKEVKKNGFFDVTRGTKGGRGRYVERLITCEKEKLEVLEAINKSINTRRSLILEGNNLKHFYDEISNYCLPVLRKNGIDRLHDLRVFYACKRYEYLTGCPAPCNIKIGDEFASALMDYEAREKISNELGHSRIQIVSSYIGRKNRRVK